MELDQETVAAVNREAARVAEAVQGRSRAALARRLAERVADGDCLMGAVVGVVEETARGTVVPIGKLDEVYREEVSVEGTVDTLGTPPIRVCSKLTCWRTRRDERSSRCGSKVGRPWSRRVIGCGSEARN